MSQVNLKPAYFQLSQNQQTQSIRPNLYIKTVKNQNKLCQNKSLAQEVYQISSSGQLTLPIVGGAAAIGLAATIAIADPEKRRKSQTQVAGTEEEAIKNYFNNDGFQRWQKIYGETDEVNKVQLDIRKGHAQTVEKVLKFLDQDKKFDIKNLRVNDMGCGTGSLTVPLIQRGAQVYASDLSNSMVQKTEQSCNEYVAKNKSQNPPQPKFEVKGLEDVDEQCHTLFCLDVMIHYPQDRVQDMINHLTTLATDRIYLSFAPKTVYYSLLKKVGELFPGPSKATRAYLHEEQFIEQALRERGWQVTNREFTATQFYFSKLVEAQKI